MAVITPSISRFRWGPECWQVAHYKAHPWRDRIGGPKDTTGTPIGNPWIAFRHSGGGTVGNLDECFDGGQAYSALWDYLLSVDRDVHFDIFSIETAQRHIVDVTAGATGIRSTKMLFGRDAVRDVQNCISSLKTWGARGFNGDPLLKINPNKGFSGGVSYGASVTALAQLMGPPVRPYPQSTASNSAHDANSWDSSVLGNVFFEGQVDSRLGYMDPLVFSGWFGTYGPNPAEFNALSAAERESLSIRAYIQNGDTKFYKPMYLLNAETGAHTYPLFDAHDSQQQVDLRSDLTIAGLPFEYELWNTGSHPMTVAGINKAYQWMRGLVLQPARTGGAVG